MRLPLLLCVRTTSDVDYGGGDRGVGTTTTSTNVDRANPGGSAGVLDEYWSEEADGGGLSVRVSGACEPLEGVREDASGGGQRGGSSTIGLRDAAGAGVRDEGAFREVAQLPGHSTGALMGVQDYGGVRISLRFCGQSRRMGGPEWETDTEDRRGRGASRSSAGGAAMHGGVEDAVGWDDNDNSALPVDHPHGGCDHPPARRRERSPLLRGPAGEAGHAPGSVSSVGAEGLRGTPCAGISAGEEAPTAGTQGVLERGELVLGGGGGERSGRGGKRTGSGRQPNSVKLMEMAAKLKALEVEVVDLKSQLARKDSDRAQWLEAEWRTRNVKLQVEAREQAERASKSRRSYVSIAAKLESAEAERDVALSRALDAETSLEASRAECVQLRADAAAAARRLATRDKMVERRDLKVASMQQLQAELDEATKNLATLRPRAAELEKEVSRMQTLLDIAEEKLADRLSTIRKFVGMQGGRPVMNRDDEELQSCTSDLASHCDKRMTLRVMDAIGEAGSAGCVSCDSLMDALVLNGWLPIIWESEACWELRMLWGESLKLVLSDRWDATLTLQLKDKLLISYDKLDEARYKFSHHRVSNQLVPLPWFINPWSGKRVNFPQPITSRFAWTPLIKAQEKRFGLRLSAGGKVASRSFKLTVAKAHARDSARGVLQTISEEEPFVIVLGADATGMGKVGITHVAVSCAPSYREGIAQQNELNINTLATSRTDDHWEGLDQVLCDGFYGGSSDELELSATCIAAEVNAVVCTGCTETALVERGFQRL